MEKEEIEAETAGNGTRRSKTGCRRCQKTPSDITGPVYFLLREQAKSQVAIRDLQEQLKVVEGRQEDMVLAIHDIQNHLVCFKDHINEFPPIQQKCTCNTEKLKSCDISRISNNKNVTSNRKLNVSAKRENFMPSEDVSITSASKLNQINCISKQDEKSNMTVDTVIVDIDNKQDSGLESDCREQGHDSTYTLTDSVRYVGENRDVNDGSILSSKDELSLLLDMISQRGLYLQQEVAELKKQKTMAEEIPLESKQEVKKLHNDNVQLQQQLSAVEEERENLRIQLSHLESASQKMESERKRLQERLDAAMSEKQQLVSRIDGLHMQFVKQENGMYKPGKNNGSEQLSLKEKSKIILNSEENRNKVSSILKENNVLELQRQLLTYTVENEVLQTKLEQTLQIYRTRVSQWEKSETMLKTHIKQLMKEKAFLHKKLEEMSYEITTTKANNKLLERTLHTMSHNFEIKRPILKNLHQNGKMNESDMFPHHNFTGMKDSQFLNDYGDRTQSLPTILLNQNDRIHYLVNNKQKSYDCDALPEMLNHQLSLNYQNGSGVNENKQLINFNDNADNIMKHVQCRQTISHIKENCDNFYFTPIPITEMDKSSPNRIAPHSDQHPSLIDRPIESEIWNKIPKSIESNISGSGNREACYSNDWEQPTLIDIQSPVKKNSYPYYKDDMDFDSIRSEFDPLSTNNASSKTESQHEIIDSLNLYVSGQKQLSSTGDSLHSASLEPGISSKFIPQNRKFNEPLDVFINSSRRYPQVSVLRNGKIGQLEKTWPISSSRPDMTKSLTDQYDLGSSENCHSILGFMSTTEGETLL
ncbi:putative leucine-rich repeat-containing protein DDB_G0290503 isoform X1 [Centruroides vittatus]|uniref:putative leucine-rich repeat-containing protein DDB_G0290503 isoform X1 n=2 Tax=Centruroides vittatus TaxID=120091 RepID=UPI00350FF9E5